MNHLDQLEAAVHRQNDGPRERFQCKTNSIGEPVANSSTPDWEEGLAGLEMSVGDHVRAFLPGKRSRRTYRVESVSEQHEMMTLREVWREQASGKEIESGICHQVQLAGLEGLEITLKAFRG